MLEVADEKGAREYEASIGAGAPEPEDYQGTDLREDERGLATAIVDDFLVDRLRRRGALRDRRLGRTWTRRRLARGPDGRAMRSTSCPATASPRRTCRRRGSTASSRSPRERSAPFEPLVDSGDSQGAAFSRRRRRRAATVFATRSVLDPERNPEAGGFFAAFEPFEPALPAELAPDTLAYVGFGDADETVSGLLAQATIRAPGIATGITDLVDRLRKDAGVDLAEELLARPERRGGAWRSCRAPPPTDASAAETSEDEVPDELQVPGCARDHPARSVGRPVRRVHRRRCRRGGRRRRPRAPSERAGGVRRPEHRQPGLPRGDLRRRDGAGASALARGRPGVRDLRPDARGRRRHWRRSSASTATRIPGWRALRGMSRRSRASRRSRR